MFTTCCVKHWLNRHSRTTTHTASTCLWGRGWTYLCSSYRHRSLLWLITKTGVTGQPCLIAWWIESLANHFLLELDQTAYFWLTLNCAKLFHTHTHTHHTNTYSYVLQRFTSKKQTQQWNWGKPLLWTPAPSKNAAVSSPTQIGTIKFDKSGKSCNVTLGHPLWSPGIQQPTPPRLDTTESPRNFREIRVLII